MEDVFSIGPGAPGRFEGVSLDVAGSHAWMGLAAGQRRLGSSGQQCLLPGWRPSGLKRDWLGTALLAHELDWTIKTSRVHAKILSMSTVLTSSVGPNETLTEHPHIVRIGTVAHVRGTRLPVRVVAQLYRVGDSVEDILRAYPHLSAAAVHDALSFYLDHRGEIEQEIAAHRAETVLAEAEAKVDPQGFVRFGPRHD